MRVGRGGSVHKIDVNPLCVCLGKKPDKLYIPNIWTNFIYNVECSIILVLNYF